MERYKLTFNSIKKAQEAYCHTTNKCKKCPFYSRVVTGDSCPFELHEACAEYAAQHPDKAVELMDLEVIDVPELTEQERAMCKAVGAKWVTLDNPRTPDSTPSQYVFLWKNKPLHSRSGKYYEAADGDCFGNLNKALFPSLVPDDCVSVE